MRHRAVLTGVLAWVLVVVVASGVTWAVIEGAGQNLLAGEDPVAETVPVPAPAQTEGAGSPSPSAKASKPRSPEPSPSARPSRTPASPLASPSGSAAAVPPRSAGPTVEDKSVERTWAGPPGLVTVRCDGSRTTLRSATPNNGYRVEVDRGTDRIEAHFESASGEYKVVARCSGGAPRFTVEGGGEDEHDE